jgi:hypothetical protein
MRQFKLLSYLLCLIALSASAQVVILSGEEVEARWKEHSQLDDLYKRIAASRFVMIGAVTKREVIGKRGAPPSIDSDVAGLLYTIAVEKTLCHHEQSAPQCRSPIAQPASPVHVFVPYEPYANGIYGHEHFPDKRYLIFLTLPDEKQQKTWTDSFTLDPRFRYYRGEEFSRGIVPLAEVTSENPNPPQPVALDKVTQLCKAMEPADVEGKLSALNILAASDDPILRREAMAAMETFEIAEGKQMHRSFDSATHQRADAWHRSG